MRFQPKVAALLVMGLAASCQPPPAKNPLSRIESSICRSSDSSAVFLSSQLRDDDRPEVESLLRANSCTEVGTGSLIRYLGSHGNISDVLIVRPFAENKSLVVRNEAIAFLAKYGADGMEPIIKDALKTPELVPSALVYIQKQKLHGFDSQVLEIFKSSKDVGARTVALRIGLEQYPQDRLSLAQAGLRDEYAPVQMEALLAVRKFHLKALSKDVEAIKNSDTGSGVKLLASQVLDSLAD